MKTPRFLTESERASLRYGVTRDIDVTPWWARLLRLPRRVRHDVLCECSEDEVRARIASDIDWIESRR